MRKLCFPCCEGSLSHSTETSSVAQSPALKALLPVQWGVALVLREADCRRACSWRLRGASWASFLPFFALFGASSAGEGPEVMERERPRWKSARRIGSREKCFRAELIIAGCLRGGDWAEIRARGLANASEHAIGRLLGRRSKLSAIGRPFRKMVALFCRTFALLQRLKWPTSADSPQKWATSHCLQTSLGWPKRDRAPIKSAIVIIIVVIIIIIIISAIVAIITIGAGPSWPSWLARDKRGATWPVLESRRCCGAAHTQSAAQAGRKWTRARV